MNRTKTIYFLSALVLIIGCYALNLSYSLFVQTEEKEIVNLTVPYLGAELSLSTVEVESGKEYLIKQTVSNTGTADMNYSISANSISDSYSVKAVTDGTNTYASIGTLAANTTEDTYFYVSNTGPETITINFTIDKNYTTITNNLTTNIDNENSYFIPVGLPYSDKPQTLAYKIIETQAQKFGGGASDISSLFQNGETKVLLPIESSFSVPSPTEFTDVETASVGLYKAEDDYGTSYYYRGANDYNYVSFAGFIWRIVRINGDGSIRLILNGTLDKVMKSGESSLVYTNTKFTTIDSDGLFPFYGAVYLDNAYVGYMYGDFDTNSTNYDDAHENIKDSTIKTYIDIFYEEYISSYESYLADTLFCGDKTLASENQYGYHKYTTFYSAYDRLSKNASLATPTLLCASSDIVMGSSLTEEQLAYSRYTSNIDISTTTNKEVLINNDLKYPIALLSADELVMAGGFANITNNSYYLNDINDFLPETWWTMTPNSYENLADVLFAGVTSASLRNNQYGMLLSKQCNMGVRPVINLRSDVIVTGGDGTKDTTVGGGPYVVNLPS